MTKEVKQKGYVTGAGALLYLTAWLVTEQCDLGRSGEIILFLLP